MRRAQASGHFVQGGKGAIFVLLRVPVDPSGETVLVVPPFAEEMNKCRRMVTEVALGLAGRGVATLVPDLYGTGDSEGDFADADWDTWCNSLARAVQWSAAQGHAVNGLLAIRLGAALAVGALAAGQLPSVRRTVLWHPVFDGARALGQFLRLRTAAGMMNGARESATDLKVRLAQGETIEVAGYGLGGRLAADLESVATPSILPATLGEIAWLDVVRDAAATLPPAMARLVEQSRAAGSSLEWSGRVAEPFWSATEIVVNPEFVRTTVEHLGGSGPRPET